MKRFRFLMMAAFTIVCASMSAQQVITLDQLKKKEEADSTAKPAESEAAKES